MPSATNRSQTGLMVVYNRVPKCASTTVLSYFMGHARFVHHVTTINDLSRGYFQYSIQEEIKLLARLYNFNFTAFIYVDHFFFINMNKKYGVPTEFVPSWINIIREPVERTISRIFYIHNLRYKVLFTNVELEACLQHEADHCKFVPSNLQFCFFVGSEGPCSPDQHFWTLEHKQAALQIAKRNVEEHYSVVGLTSDLEGTVKLLEAYLPRFFKGISFNKERFATYKNVNAQRPPNITEKARRMIENHPAMQLEKDFYNFCVQRFRKQLNHLQERELILETI